MENIQKLKWMIGNIRCLSIQDIDNRNETTVQEHTMFAGIRMVLDMVRRQCFDPM